MLIRIPTSQAHAILGAMHAIALEHGDGAVTETDRRTIEAAALIILGLDVGDPAAFPPVDPAGLAAAVTDGDEAALAVRMIAVMSLVDGRLDSEKTAHVQAYADELGVHESAVGILVEACAGEIAAATACIVRKNAESYPGVDLTSIDVDAAAPFLPYRNGHEDPALEARYAALGELPADTFGHAFYDHFHRNGFSFPGNEHGLAEAFTTPHDSSHVLSGYSTTQQGEMCVSTFIGAMHPDEPMTAEVLPVLFSWHLGIKLNSIAGASTGAFEPRMFWTAWERGSVTTVDVVHESWDFWAATSVPLEVLRAEYSVPPVDPALRP